MPGEASPEPMRARIGPFAAVRALLQGIPLLASEPRLRRRAIVGVFVNGLIFFGFLLAAGWGAFAVTDGLTEGDTAVAILGWLARIGLLIGLFVAAPVMFAILGDIVLPAFHSTVFHESRRIAGGPAFTHDAGLVGEVKSVAIDINRLVRFLALSALLLLLHFVPLIGSALYLVLQVGLASYSMGWDVLARHFEGHGLTLAQQRQWLRRNLHVVLPVGLVATGLCLIPLVQLYMVSSNAAGAGILSARLDGAPPFTVRPLVQHARGD